MQYNSDGTEKICALLQPKKVVTQPAPTEVLKETQEPEPAALFKEPNKNDRPREQN